MASSYQVSMGRGVVAAGLERLLQALGNLGRCRTAMLGIRRLSELGILRTLSPGCWLGVAWWLFSDEAHDGDGRHVGYLTRPDQWRHFV